MIRIVVFAMFCLFGIRSDAQIKQSIFDFEFEGVILNGVLNIPEQTTPKGLVIIVHGSGRTNAVAGQLHYDVRETLVKAGYATYMWDKMGCGNSGGSFDYNQEVENSAEEVITAINALRLKEVPGAMAVGLWGISRAGWICPLVINEFKDIKFWISVSGVDDKESFNYLFEENLRIEGHPEDSIQILVNELKDGVRITHNGESFETYMTATQNLRSNKFLSRFNNGNVISEEAYYEYQKTFMQDEVDENSGLMVYVSDFDSLLSNIKCPVLALFGENDKNVDWNKTKLLYEKTLSGNSSLTMESFPACNHNMFKSVTGGFFEFQDNDLPWDRCDGFLEMISDWLNKNDF